MIETFPLVPTYPYDINLGSEDLNSVGEDQSRITLLRKAKDSISLNFPYVSKAEFDIFWTFWVAHGTAKYFNYYDPEYLTTRKMKMINVPNIRLKGTKMYEITCVLEYA